MTARHRGPAPSLLQSDRLLLRPTTIEDVDALLGVFGDPRVMAAFGEGPFDRPQMEHWVRGNLAHLEEHGYGPFTVIHREDGLVIGDVCLEHMDIDGVPELELGYDLRSDHWGRGLATEAACLVRDHAFDVIGAARLISIVRSGNAASARVAEKVGMSFERDLNRWGISYRLYAVER